MFSEALRAARACRYVVGGYPVDPITEPELLSLVSAAVEDGRRLVLVNANLHAIHCARRSPGMARLAAGSRVVSHIDGMPLVWIGGLMGRNVTSASRLTHIDLVPRILQLAAARSWPVMFVGSAPERLGSAHRAFQSLAPGLNVACRDGYFDLTERGVGSKQDDILATVRSVGPKILFVGMGMPRQEEWIESVCDEVDVPVIMPVGGFIDYFTGRAAMPPRWLGPIGLEWLYRLAHDPRRLFVRYCVEPIFLLVPITGSIVSTRWKQRFAEKATS